MKKKLLAVLLSVACVLSLTACDKKASSTEASTSTVEPKTEITVTFKNGISKIGEVKAYAGELVTGADEFASQEGYEFQGWFETPSFLESSRKDLSKDTFEKSTVLYGSFRNTNVAEDTRSWYIVGDGTSPVLKTSAWAGSSVDDAGKDMCQLKATGNVTNEFQITLDIYSGDMFQVVYDWQWDGQYGFGKFTELEADCFESGGGLSGEASKANVSCIKDGNYTITLTTDPDNSALDTLTIVRNGDAAPADSLPAVEEEPYVVSDATSVVIKGSWVADWSENIDLTRVEGTNTFAITKELAKDTEVYIMVWDNGEDTGIGFNATAVVDDASKALLADAYNIKVAEDGTYTFTVDVDALTVTVTK